MPLTPADLPPHIRAQLPGARESKQKASTQNTSGGRWFCYDCALAMNEAWLLTPDDEAVDTLPPKPPILSTWVSVERHCEASGHARYECAVPSVT